MLFRFYNLLFLRGFGYSSQIISEYAFQLSRYYFGMTEELTGPVLTVLILAVVSVFVALYIRRLSEVSDID